MLASDTWRSLWERLTAVDVAGDFGSHYNNYGEMTTAWFCSVVADVVVFAPTK